MRVLYCRFVFAVTISTLLIFLAGCAIGIRPRSHDAPTEDYDYHEESIHRPYYDAGAGSRTYYYDSNYDPWTMGTYYQHYSGPPRSSGSSDSSNASSTRSETKRPAVKGRDSTSVRQSKAPSNGTTSLRKNRSSISGQTETSSESSSSSVAHRKVRRNAISRKSQTSDKPDTKQKTVQTRTTTRKTRREPVRSKSEKEDEEKSKASH